MTTYDLWQVDAFAERVFTGNPAAVMLLDDWLPDDILQSIAVENNLAETAYAISRGEGKYDLRWFTPGAEVRLCGHATLATAHVLWTEKGVTAEQLTFSTLSGDLHVRRQGSDYVMDFPLESRTPIEIPESVVEGIGVEPLEMYSGLYLMAVLNDADQVRAITPNLFALSQVTASKSPHENCLIVTAPGDGEVDFVSRLFGPTVDIPEDPVTGSAHCMLAPYWAEKLGKNPLKAYQASPRGGYVGCEVVGDRVKLIGRAITYLRGQIEI